MGAAEPRRRRQQVVAWIGGAVTLVGVVLLLVLAVQRGYIGPVPRLLLGAALGAALVAIADAPAPRAGRTHRRARRRGHRSRGAVPRHGRDDRATTTSCRRGPGSVSAWPSRRAACSSRGAGTAEAARRLRVVGCAGKRAVPDPGRHAARRLPARAPDRQFAGTAATTLDLPRTRRRCPTRAGGRGRRHGRHARPRQRRDDHRGAVGHYIARAGRGGDAAGAPAAGAGRGADRAGARSTRPDVDRRHVASRATRRPRSPAASARCSSRSARFAARCGLPRNSPTPPSPPGWPRCSRRSASPSPATRAPSRVARSGRTARPRRGAAAARRVARRSRRVRRGRARLRARPTRLVLRMWRSLRPRTSRSVMVVTAGTTGVVLAAAALAVAWAAGRVVQRTRPGQRTHALDAGSDRGALRRDRRRGERRPGDLAGSRTASSSATCS